MQQRPDFHGQIYVWFSNWDQIKMLEIRLSDVAKKKSKLDTPT
jgi:hypothetical protein